MRTLHLHRDDVTTIADAEAALTSAVYDGVSYLSVSDGGAVLVDVEPMEHWVLHDHTAELHLYPSALHPQVIAGTWQPAPGIEAVG